MTSISTAPHLFSPETQTSIQEVQTRFREIDMSLSQQVEGSLTHFPDAKHPFVYSYLAACISFVGSDNLDKYKEEVQKFAKDVVKPVVESCLETLETVPEVGASGEAKLQLKLLNLQDKVKFYPKAVTFTNDTDKTKLDALNAATNDQELTGTYELYKLHESDETYYAGLIAVSDTLFNSLVGTLDGMGYRSLLDDHQEGSTRYGNGYGHIGTINAKELSNRHTYIVDAHNRFIAENGPNAPFSFTGIKVGHPQSGRLAHVVAVTVAAGNLSSYRESCGLEGNMQFDPHLTIFSREIKPLESLANTSITSLSENDFSKRFSICWRQKTK